MGRRLRKAGIVSVVGLIALLAGAQLVRPARTNPSIDAGRTIQAKYGTTSELVGVIDRSCGDCHSNATDWSRYSKVAPLSWLIAYGVNGGRKVLNFSEWDSYPPARQQELLAASCTDASNGKMPGSAYTMVRPEARLSPQDIEIICAASRAIETSTATASIKP